MEDEECVVVDENVRYQAAADDDDGVPTDGQQHGRVSLPTAVSATREDYVEERYKVDRRKLEQMIQGKQTKNKQKDVQNDAIKQTVPIQTASLWLYPCSQGC